MAATCRSCGAIVVWATHHRTAKLAPLEERADGSFVLQASPVDDLLFYRAGDDDDEGPRYGNHFATCPKAAEHRRA